MGGAHPGRSARSLRSRVQSLLDRGSATVGRARDDDRKIPDEALRARANDKARAGDLAGAMADAEALQRRRPQEPANRRLVQRIRGQRQVLTPGWLPAAPALTTEDRTASHPVRDRIMMLVSASLPYRHGGFANRTHGVARCLLDAGMEPQVVTFLGFPASEDVHGAPPSDHIDGVTYRRVAPDARRERPLDRLLEEHAAATSELCRELQPALILTAETAGLMEPTAQVGLALGRAHGLPVVFEVRGFREDSWLARGVPGVEHSERYRLARDTDTWCMNAADAVVTLSQVMADAIVERGVPADHITIIPNAVDADRFVPLDRDSQLAQAHGIQPDDVVIGYVGAFQPYEGLPTLVDAVGALVDRGRPVRLLLVGEGTMRAALRARITELGLGDRLTMTGRVPHTEIVRYYSLLDVVANPRTSDRVSRLVSPTKPLEALATATALVVSRTPAMLDLVDEGRTALAVDPDSVEDLAEVLDRLVGDPELRRRLGTAARESVVTRHSWAANGERYRALFTRLGAA